MIQGRGLTETDPLATVSRRMMKYAHRELSVDAQFENVAKARQRIPGLEVEIVDEAFRPLPHDGESTGEMDKKAVRARLEAEGYRLPKLRENQRR